MVTSATAPLRGSLCRSELGCGGGNEHGFVAQNAGDYHDSFIGLFPLLLLDGFAHGGHGLHRVAGVEAWRVELVLEPRPVRQSPRRGSLAPAFHPQMVSFAAPA